MRFLADMGISPKTVEWLRDSHHDAAHIGDERLHKAADSDIIAKAVAENRIILTHDLDFGAIMAGSRAALPSLVIFRLANMQPDRVSRYLEVLIERYGASLEEGVIVVITEKKIRVRHLPI